MLAVSSNNDGQGNVVSNTSINKVPVAMIMTRMPNVVTLQEDERILDAGYKIIQHQIDSLPVISKDNPALVIGKVSKTVVLKHFIDEAMHLKK